MAASSYRALSLPLAAVLLASLTLAGCGSLFGDDDKKHEDKKEQPKIAEVKKPTPICPQVAIVRELDTLRDYGGETPAPGQLVSAARLTHIDGSCEYRKADKDDKDVKEGVDIEYELALQAGRGPRLGGLTASFPYFVAVVDANGTILTKDLLTAQIKFPSDSKITDETEKLHVFIPLPQAQQDSGPYYRVLAGFQLTPEQLAALKN